MATTWALPSKTDAGAYPLQELVNITSTLKPNVLIVLESAESMQGLPGENVARYNAVGADCEAGNASCRLVGQRGRWGYSGMGSKGIYFGTTASSCTNTFTDTISDTQTFSNTQTWLNPSATLTSSNTVTSTNTVNTTNTVTNSNTITNSNTVTNSNTITNSNTVTNSNTITNSNIITNSNTVTSSNTITSSDTKTAAATRTVTLAAGATVTWTATNADSFTWTVTGTATTPGLRTKTATTTNINPRTPYLAPIWTVTDTVNPTLTKTLTAAAGGFASWTGTATFTQTGSNYGGPQINNSSGSGTVTGFVTSSYTQTASWSGTAYGTVTTTAYGTVTTTAYGTSTSTAYGTSTATALGTVSSTALGTVTTTTYGTVTSTGLGTVSSTAHGTITSTGTQTGTGTASATTHGTDTFTETGTLVDTESVEDTETYTATGTQTDGACAFPRAPDPGDCLASGADSTNRGFCNYATLVGTATGTNTATAATSYVPCASEAICNAFVKGDFCRYISELDYSGRAHSERCIASVTSTATATSTDWGTCKRGITSQNMGCGYSTGTCPNTLYGDFCAEGKPAKMCEESGIWCASNSDCLTYRCSGSGDLCTDAADCAVGEACIYQSLAEQCVPASSRMMIVKRALRRAISQLSDEVNFGLMTTYQGRNIPSTGSDVSTAVFPYVRVTGPTATATETKLLTRGELELAGCFTLTGGPASSCTIDYGGNGALNSDASLNRITYTKIGGSDSLWNIPRVDASGKSKQIAASWSSCASSAILPFCAFSGQGTGEYEGSYYTFQYTKGAPVLSGPGSMGQPVYFEVYKGKSPTIGGVLYNAIDAERSDFINDGIYGRPAYQPTSLALASPYTMVTRSIVTSVGTSTGVSTTSVLAPDPARETTVPPPWVGATDAGSCGSTTGAIWNHKAVPALNATTFGGPGITAKAISRSQRALMTTARLEKASFGGVTATGEPSPIACSLKNDAVPDSYHGAAGYLSAIQASDTTNNGNQAPCWSNNIVLVVDGKSDGPGDIGPAADCASAACAYDTHTNPSLAGCQCGAITKAYALAHPGSGAPIQTHVVVAVPGTRWSVRYPYTYAFLWNLAVAGSPKFDGTPIFGATEDELYKGISQKVALAAHSIPSYTTTAPVPGAGVQDPNTLIVAPSTYLYSTATSYPSWKGTVRAYDTSSGVQLLWDAATVAANGHPADWTKRRIFFQNGGAVSQVAISALGSITNKSDLFSAGLGATADEAERIMQWLLGKPGMGNRSPLMGPVSASTPIVVGQAPDNGLKGAKAYSAATWTRPPLVYVGSDDGMLHAFFAHAGSKTIGAATYQGGEEAFTFIPKDMLPVITKLYANGGQPMAPDKGEHIFGLAGSPKVKDMCIGSTCQTDTAAGSHTVLVMTEGPGGNKPFALDITNVVDASLGLLPSNPSLLWSATGWDAKMGETLSVPAFYFAGYGDVSAPNRVLFASGYPTTAPATQGLHVVDANAATGDIVQSRSVTLATPSPTSCSSPYTQTLTVMADVAVARDYSSLANSQNLKAAYTGDTWGNVYQYAPSASALTTIAKLGCGHPIHFSPAVVQLDRLPKSAPTGRDKIYLAQVTNSNLDSVTQPVSSTYPGSKLVVTRINANTSSPVVDTTFNSSGSITLSACATGSTSSDCICIQNVSGSVVSDFNGSAKLSTQGCAAAGGANLPESARPVGTPTAILRSDGLGFQVITNWYDATAITNVCPGGSSNSFNYGKSYITVHEFRADGAFYQLKGITLNNAVLTGGTFVGTSFLVDGIKVASDHIPTSVNLGQTFSTTQQVLSASKLGRFARTTWTERVE